MAWGSRNSDLPDEVSVFGVHNTGFRINVLGLGTQGQGLKAWGTRVL